LILLRSTEIRLEFVVGVEGYSPARRYTEQKEKKKAELIKEICINLQEM
jgi:hypothetical protein